MKKTKAISIILTVIMLMSAISVGAFATTPEIEFSIKAGEQKSINLLQKEISGNSSGAVLKFTNASSYKFYDQLTFSEKLLYNEIVSAKAGMNSSDGRFTATLTDYKTFEFPNSVYRVFAALVDDIPEFYWILACPFNINAGSQGSKLIIEFSIEMDSLPIYSSFTALKNEYNDTLNAAESFSVSGETRYEKVKSIVDGLCDMAEYADITGCETPNNSKVFYPSACLLSPYRPVCDGYSKAFKMICDANNIPSIIVVGEGYTYNWKGELEGAGHAWNYVQMEDGKWYAVDVTWIDGVRSVGLYYFLVGENSLDDSGDKFSATHIPDGLRFHTSSDDIITDDEKILVSYPALSSVEFDPDNVIIPDPIPDPDPDPDPAPDPDPDPSPTPDVTLGDVNKDGKISVVDAKWVLQSIAGAKKLDVEQTVAADVNKDSKITVVDAKWILQSLAGIRLLEETYADYPMVPDFGSFSGIECREYDELEGNEILCSYYYDVSETDENIYEIIYNYEQLLEKNGFTFNFCELGDNYFFEEYVNKAARVGVNIEYYENEIIISPYFTPLIYNDFGVPDLGESFGIGYVLYTYFSSDDEIMYDYLIDDIINSGHDLTEYYDILEKAGFTHVYDYYFESDGFDGVGFVNSSGDVGVLIYTDYETYTICIDMFNIEDF